MSTFYQICNCKVVTFDMDGTLVLGDKALPCASLIIKYLRTRGIKFKIITNNSSIPNKYHAKRLTKILHIKIDENEILSSLDHVAMLLLSKTLHTGVYPLLTSVSQNYLANNYGIRFTTLNPRVVVVGFDTELTYEKLKRACILIQRGVPWVLAHPDVRCPTHEGFIPDAGSIGKVIELTTGVPPLLVAGKPSKDLLILVAKEFRVDPSQICYVGDRLYTDVQMALESEVNPVLLLSGETREENLKTLDPQTSRKLLVFKNLCELLTALRNCNKR